METGAAGWVELRACASGGGSQASGWGCEVPPGLMGEQSLHLSSTGIYSLWGQRQFREYFGVSWFVEGETSIEVPWVYPRNFLGKGLTLQGLDDGSFPSCLLFT